MDALIARKGMILSGSIDDYPEGIIIAIDKPYRWTSADVIRKIKWAACRHFGKKNLKVGHAGTLDPLATGVLLVCIGKATKLADDLQRHDKEYIAGVSFGATTPSYDLEKDVDQTFPLVGREDVEAVLPQFIGRQEQVAPLFSAKSVDGVRAYELARKAYRQAALEGGEFDHTATELLSKQIIEISSMEILDFHDGPDPSSLQEVDKPNPRINVADVSAHALRTASIRVACSKGTYIRALARDLGEAAGSGAFLTSLQRSRSGIFKVEDALTVDDAMEMLG